MVINVIQDGRCQQVADRLEILDLRSQSCSYETRAASLVIPGLIGDPVIVIAGDTRYGEGMSYESRVTSQENGAKPLTRKGELIRRSQSFCFTLNSQSVGAPI